MTFTIIKSLFSALTGKDDPVYSCAVYKSVGCAHVDGPTCDLKTCDIKVTAKITPSGFTETEN